MKKKIGILTFHNSFNYGALLQAYATQKFLSENGYDASFIDYSNNYENKGNKMLSIRKNLSFKRNIIQNIKNVVFGGYYYTNKCFSRFIKQLYKTEKMNSNSNFDSFYAIISGSDQIWNPNIYGGILDTMYLLDFDYRGKKISYASSMGSYLIDDSIKGKYKEALEKYYAISVREEHAANELKKIGIKNIQIVCDPTMLLSRKYWLSVANEFNTNVKSKKYILVYLMSKYENYQDKIKAIKDYYKLDVVFVTFSRIKRNFVDEYALGYSPFEFLSLINNAELVLTNSFHGTVFSLLFNKNFFNLENSGNSKRTETLLKTVGLDNRIIKPSDNVIEKIKDIKDVDYFDVNLKIEDYSTKSKLWLLNALDDRKE